MQKSVLVDNEEVCYREVGNGFPILILPGWGEKDNTAFFSLQGKLAERGYRVILLDFPGFGRSPDKFIPSDKWGEWLEKFIEVCGFQEFVMISHSGGGWIALQYLKEEHSLCRGGILLSPGLMLPWQTFFWQSIRKALRIFSPFIFPGMKWVKNKETWATAQSFLTPPPQDLEVKVPCVIWLGRRDPLRFLIGGWRRIRGCNIETFNWDHSPQIRDVAKLAKNINITIRKRFNV